MAGEKARITEEIISRIRAHSHVDTNQYIEDVKGSLNRQILDYDNRRANDLKLRIEKKQRDSAHKEKQAVAETKWKAQSALRNIRSAEIQKLHDKTYSKLESLLGTEDYVAYLKLAKAKAPKTGTFMVREEDLEYFSDVKTQIATYPLGGFKVVDGSRIIDFTLEIAFKEVFDAFSNTLKIDEWE